MPEQRSCGRRGDCGLWPLDVEAAAPASSVAVMAPALTESGPQKPENLLNPLPAGGFLSAEQAAQVNDPIINHFFFSFSCSLVFFFFLFLFILRVEIYTVEMHRQFFQKLKDVESQIANDKKILKI